MDRCRQLVPVQPGPRIMLYSDLSGECEEGRSSIVVPLRWPKVAVEEFGINVAQIRTFF